VSDLKLFKVRVSVEMAVLANDTVAAEFIGLFNFRKDPSVKVLSEHMAENDLSEFGSRVPWTSPIADKTTSKTCLQIMEEQNG